MHRSIIGVHLRANEKVIIVPDTPHKDVPYYKVGNGKKNIKGTSMNLIQLMADLTKPEQVMIKLLEKAYDPWDEIALNCVRLPTVSLTSTEQQYIKKAYKLLEAKGMVKRIKREFYMINPYLMLPSVGQVEANALWDSLT